MSEILHSFARPTSTGSLESELEKLDRKQEVDDALARGVLSGVGMSLKSYFLNAEDAPTMLAIFYVFLLGILAQAESGSMLGIELSGALLFCALANSYAY